MYQLKLASCMAENSQGFCRAVAVFIENRVRIPTHDVTGIPWQERERGFDEGEIHILWICGLPYVEKADANKCDIELLVVPVPSGERYQGRPAYFSDVIVRRDRIFQNFFELRGASWAYNEPRSHSGFNPIRAYLAEFGQRKDFSAQSSNRARTGHPSIGCCPAGWTPQRSTARCWNSYWLKEGRSPTKFASSIPSDRARCRRG
jgi:phosphonate transport system substrate-binding protein